MKVVSFATPEELNAYSDALQQLTVEMHEGLEDGLTDAESLETQHRELDAIGVGVDRMTHEERLAVARRARRRNADMAPVLMSDLELDYKAGRLGPLRSYRPVAHSRRPQSRRPRTTASSNGPSGRSTGDDDPHPLAPPQAPRHEGPS